MLNGLNMLLSGATSFCGHKCMSVFYFVPQSCLFRESKCFSCNVAQVHFIQFLVQLSATECGAVSMRGLSRLFACSLCVFCVVMSKLPVCLLQVQCGSARDWPTSSQQDHLGITASGVEVMEPPLIFLQVWSGITCSHM